MGDLPLHRVNPPQMPFVTTGVDYTGAIELRAARIRGSSTYKGYIAVFICLETKAVHLELVTGLTTEHFLLAFERFTGRRGMVQDLYSDNGTNFVGADSQLKGLVKQFRDDYETLIAPKWSQLRLTWHFSPPHVAYSRETHSLRTRLRNVNLKPQFSIFNNFRDIRVHTYDFLKFVGVANFF